MKQLTSKLLLLLTLPLLLWSCSKDDSDEMDDEETKVMLVHASPDAPAVNVQLNNTLVAPNLSYPNNTEYITVNTGNNNIKVSVAPLNITVLDTNLNLTTRGAYTMFAIDRVSTGNAKAVIVPDNLTTPASGKAHVRFFHFSPDAPAVNIALSAGGTPLFSNRSFNDQATTPSYANFTAIDAGTYNLEVRAAGTNNVLLTIPNVPVTAGKIYTVFARGLAGGTGNQALGAQVIVNN